MSIFTSSQSTPVLELDEDILVDRSARHASPSTLAAPDGRPEACAERSSTVLDLVPPLHKLPNVVREVASGQLAPQSIFSPSMTLKGSFPFLPSLTLYICSTSQNPFLLLPSRRPHVGPKGQQEELLVAPQFRWRAWHDVSTCWRS